MELTPSRPVEHLGDSDLSFGGKLQPALKIHEDGGESGCGGKVWIAGELLCEFLLEKSDSNGVLSKWQHEKDSQIPLQTVLELGSGTGLVGLCLGMMCKFRCEDSQIYITDIDQLVPLMERNIELNKIQNNVIAKKLWWGEPLESVFAPKEGIRTVDLILAADCVYLEKAFPLLEKTLLDLTDCEQPPVVLMSYKKRRKADKNFFRNIKKNFLVSEIKDFARYDQYLKQRTHLFQLIRITKA